MARLWSCPSIVQYTWRRKQKSRIDSQVKKLKCQDTLHQSTTPSSELSALRHMIQYVPGSTGLDSTSQSNIWWSLIRSKHNDLLNYFVHDKRDLSPAYVKHCEKFLDSICWPSYYGGSNTGGKIFKVKKQQASSSKRQASSNKLDRA